MKKALIISSIVLFIIIVAVVLYFVLRDKNKSKQNQIAELQAKLNNPSITSDQRKIIADEIAVLQQAIITNPPASPVIPPANTPPTQTPAGFPLKSGSRGQYVTDIQNATNTKCNAKMSQLLVADGIWGPKTQTAIHNCFGVYQIDYTLYQKIMSGESSYGPHKHVFWHCPKTGDTYYLAEKCNRACGGHCVPEKAH